MTAERRSLTQSLLLSAGFAGAFFVLTFIILGKLAPHYDFFRDPISALLGPTGVGSAQRANFIVFGLLLCLFAIGLRRELLPGGAGATVIPVFQFLSGVGVVGAGVFIQAPLHLVCDLIAFNSALAVLFAFGWRFRRAVNWRWWSTYSVSTAALMMTLLAAFGFFTSTSGPAGAAEKVATTIRALWSVLLTAKLLRGATF